MNIPIELHEPVVRLLRQKGMVRAETVADCKRIVEHRQSTGEQVTTLQMLIELGQVQVETAEQLAAECAPEEVRARPAIPMNTLILIAVAAPVLLILALLAFRSRPNTPEPRHVSSGPREFDTAEVDAAKKATNPDKTADEQAAEKAYQEFLERQAKKSATVGRPPTLAAGQSAWISDRSKLTDPDLVLHFVACSFAYPSTWSLETAEGQKTSPFFARVSRVEKEGDATHVLESFTLFPYWFNSQPKKIKEQVVKDISRLEGKVLSKFCWKYKRLREGDMKVGGFDGYGIEAEAFDSGDPGARKFFLRLVVLPPGTGDQTHGLCVLELLSTRVPEVGAIEDLGVKGELPTFRASLTLGG